LLFPPHRFAAVEADVYRGGYPTQRNFRFLRRLRLRSMVNLSAVKETDDLHDWCEHEEVEYVHYPAQKSKGDKGEPAVSLSTTTVALVLNRLINPQNLPAYVFCLDGVEATGIVMMCLRKVK